MTEDLQDSLFIRACRGLPNERPLVWFMRQAGRYMPEYRAIGAQHSMLETIFTPELAAEVTLQPINAFGFDAAIIFADILPPLMGMGVALDFVKGTGPVIGNPLARPYDIDMLATAPLLGITEAHIAAVRRAFHRMASDGAVQ